MSPAGVLTVRAWREEADGSLRARVSATSDILAVKASTSVAGSAAELHLILDRWLATFEGAPPAAP